MELDFAFCAKYADVGQDGLVAVIGGGLYLLGVLHLPASVSAMSLVGRATVPPEDRRGDRKMRIELFGPSGDRHPLEVEFPVDAKAMPDDPTRPVKWIFSLNMQNVVFGMEGEHEFRISVDGRQLGKAPIYVKRQPVAEGKQT